MITLSRLCKLVLLIGVVAVLAPALGGCVYTLGDQPSAVLQADKSSGAAPLSVIFDISDSSDPDGTITSYELQFGDGTSIAGENLATPKAHTYADDGYYTAVLTVTDNDEFTSHAKLHITVNNPGPTVGFTCTPQVVQPGDTVTCTACDRATDPAGLRTKPKSVITYEWDFGDGQQAFSQSCSVTHVYKDLGTFDVSLTIYDDDGAAAEETAPDYVTVRGKIYWTEWRKMLAYPDFVSVGLILRANLMGVGREELVSDELSHKRGIALDIAAGKMYWTDEEAGKIERTNLDGTGSVETLVTGLSAPTAIALNVAAGKMYWTDTIDETISWATLDGTARDSISVRNMSLGIALDVAAGKMYWTDADGIQRADLDGTNIEDAINLPSASAGIALDIAAGKVYWTGEEGIQRANFDGTGSIELLISLSPTFTDAAYCLALDIAAGKMYWTNTFGNTIRRSNLDGTNVEDVVSWASLPYGVALEP